MRYPPISENTVACVSVEGIARLAHEINRVYCESMFDFSQKSWDDSPDWQRESCINGVQFLIDNPDATPEKSHANWCKVKLADGWSYGKVKNAVDKTHPCLVDYTQLPDKQQAKDKFFHTVVRNLTQ